MSGRSKRDINVNEMSKNVDVLRERLSRTELSLQNLEQLSQREFAIDDPSHEDLPPALTMEELMLGSDAESLASYGGRINLSEDFAPLIPDDSMRSPRKRNNSKYGDKLMKSFETLPYHGRDSTLKVDYSKFESEVKSNSTHDDLNVIELSSDHGNHSNSASRGWDPPTRGTGSRGSSVENISPRRPISARSNATSVTILGHDDDSMNQQYSEKMTQLRSDNARLKTLVSQLRQQLSIVARTPPSPNQAPTDVDELIISLKDEIKTNERTLRKAEDKLEYNEVINLEKDGVIVRLKEELVGFKKMVEDCEARRKSAESERNKALYDSSKLSERFSKIHEAMSAKLSQSRALHKSMTQANQERDNMMQQCNSLTLQNNKLKSQLKASEEGMKALERKIRMDEVGGVRVVEQQVRELVGEVERKHMEIKKLKAENIDISHQHQQIEQQFNQLVDQQKQLQSRLMTSQRELEDSKLEVQKLSQSRMTEQRNALSEVTNVRPLESISPRKHRAQISELNMKLATKESQVQRLEARVKSYAVESDKLDEIRGELLGVVEKSRQGERRANELEDLVHLLEDEKTKIMKKLTETEDSLHDKLVETDSLESRLKERTSMLSKHQIEMEELKEKLSKTKSEMKEKSCALTSLSNEHDNKCKLNNELRDKLTHAERSLEEMTRALEGAAELSGKQEVELRREIKKLKKIHAEQSEELMEQNQTLSSDVEKWKQQAVTMRNQSSRFNEALVASSNRIQELEGQVRHLEEEGRCRVQSHEEVVGVLEGKCLKSSNHIVALERALSQCKDELTNHVARMHEAESNFDHQVAMKGDQIKKLEIELKLSTSSLNEESRRMVELESALEERHVMLREAATRIGELEESQSLLQTQVSKQEHKILLMDEERAKLVGDLERRLEDAGREVDEKKEQFMGINEALRQVEGDFQQSKSALCALEREVNELRSQSEVKDRELTRSSFEWGEMKRHLDVKIELVASLEEEIQRLERKRKKLEEKSLNLETELTQVRCHAQETLHHNQELENFSQNRNVEILKKDEMINKLQDALQLSKSAHKWLEDENRKLERGLEDRGGELKERAKQLSNLDAQLHEIRNTTGKKNLELLNRVQLVEQQLSERNQQVKQLDDQLSLLREESREGVRKMEEQEQHGRRLGRELEQKEQRINDLEKTIESERRSREEKHQSCLETTQELRMTREREQNMTRQIQDCEREIGRLTREMEQLMLEVEEAGSVNKEKDARLQSLTKQLSEVNADKVAMETKWRGEVDRMQVDVGRIREQYVDKITKLEHENSELRMLATVATGDQRQAMNSALERQQALVDENNRTKEAMLALERELVARKQVIESANDAIIMKDAEIARLETKYSGLERGVAMSSLPNIKLKCQESITRPHDNDVTPTFLGTSPWPPKDNNLTGSLFNGLESELGSIAPSYVPIAASTKRHHPTNQPDVDTSSFFMTSSPTPDVDDVTINSGYSVEDDSLYKRVFADTIHDSTTARGCTRATVSKTLDFDHSDVTLRPEKCMADLQEKLRASEQRRRDVTSKLRHLKATSSS
uniref:coiled-coil domain-containing protein 18-like isoform X2 n=1 Tax=Ciona intestinalis TaxID=7719 RepID=UPI000EF4A3B1|nr:coiled-coil domain-containing protein 18-like isoform X2 [Ciona intestinalis]|eukprot:XP_026695535.1 coiled-coil domain-containing protein 18-like isoform X2 [Ciona intestinalis]